MSNKIKSVLKILIDGRMSLIKTIYLNLKILPLRKAILFPIAVSRNVKIDKCKRNSIQINGKVSPLMILLGFGGSKDLTYLNSRKSYFGIHNNGKIIFNGKAQFAPHFSLYIDNSIMEIGKQFSCNNNCIFSCKSGITIGNGCLIGGSVTIRDSDGHNVYDLDEKNNIIFKHLNKNNVVIGNNVWIANKCDIIKGTFINDNSIVAYGTLCTKAFKEKNVIIAGCPAKILKKNVKWEY